VTVVPDVPLGTLNVQVNAPVALVVRDPVVQLLTGMESNSSEVRAADTVNPVPDTVTVAPTGPWIGLTMIVGVVTVKVPVAVWPPGSVAVTVVPAVPLGTLNVQLNVPVAPVVSDPTVQLVIALLSKVKDASAVETENPVPETVTVAPMGPWVGLTVIAGVVTVNAPIAV
jgi:hypothetical protein